jgi:hypothetical protein
MILARSNAATAVEFSVLPITSNNRGNSIWGLCFKVSRFLACFHQAFESLETSATPYLRQVDNHYFIWLVMRKLGGFPRRGGLDRISKEQRFSIAEKYECNSIRKYATCVL